MTNQTKLRALIEQHGLTRKQISELASVSERTVRSWLIEKSDKHHYRDMPDRAIELIELKLKDRK